MQLNGSTTIEVSIGLINLSICVLFLSFQRQISKSVLDFDLHTGFFWLGPPYFRTKKKTAKQPITALLRNRISWNGLCDWLNVSISFRLQNFDIFQDFLRSPHLIFKVQSNPIIGQTKPKCLSRPKIRYFITPRSWATEYHHLP